MTRERIQILFVGLRLQAAVDSFADSIEPEIRTTHGLKSSALGARRLLKKWLVLKEFK